MALDLDSTRKYYENAPMKAEPRRTLYERVADLEENLKIMAEQQASHLERLDDHDDIISRLRKEVNI